MKDYKKEIKLYGDDFSPEQIKKWYDEESEGYSSLGNEDYSKYYYGYHLINKTYGFDKVKETNYDNVLGFGSAWGHEFEPIVSRIKKLTIIEPSDKLINDKIGQIKPKYIKPNPSGELLFDDHQFDLITCLQVLHHIPNVSFVLKEISRVLKPGGYLLLSEPIVSMGDPSLPRYGLTKNERGIPMEFFDLFLKKEGLEIISKEYFFTATSIVEKTFGRILKKPVYSYKLYVGFDKYLSKLLNKRVKYKAQKKIDKFAPSSIYYVIKKPKYQI